MISVSMCTSLSTFDFPLWTQPLFTWSHSVDWVDCDPGMAKKTIHPLGYSTWLLDGHVLHNEPMRACPGAFAGSVGKTLCALGLLNR